MTNPLDKTENIVMEELSKDFAVTTLLHSLINQSSKEVWKIHLPGKISAVIEICYEHDECWESY